MTDLITRLREDEGADRKLDMDIWRWSGGDYALSQNAIPSYTLEPLGLGDCIALAEKALPRSDLQINSTFLLKEYGSKYHHVAFSFSESYVCKHKSLCRAFLIALISAHEATLITAKEASHD